MASRWGLLIVVLAFITSLVAETQEPRFFAGSLDEALRFAQKENKPCLIYFDLESG